MTNPLNKQFWIYVIAVIAIACPLIILNILISNGEPFRLTVGSIIISFFVTWFYWKYLLSLPNPSSTKPISILFFCNCFTFLEVFFLDNFTKLVFTSLYYYSLNLFIFAVLLGVTIWTSKKI